MSESESENTRWIRGYLADQWLRVDPQDPAEIDWPARFRAAADVADGETQLLLTRLVTRLERYPHKLEAIGRALLGVDS